MVFEIHRWEVEQLDQNWMGHLTSWSIPVVFYLRYVKTPYANQNETQELLEHWTSSDPRTHEYSSPNWGAGMPEIILIISLTGQNHINNW
jgi:hypothetical protein